MTNLRDAVTLQTLPPELLLQIAANLSPADKIRAAFALPEVFLTQNLHIFYYDAERHLNIRSDKPPSTKKEESRSPLVIEAIGAHLGTDYIGRILGFCEEQCIRRGVWPDIFLNSCFPDNRPADSPPASPTTAHLRRNVIPPLHAAVKFQYPEAIGYLLQWGADVNQVYAFDEVMDVNPLQYALALVAKKYQQPLAADVVYHPLDDTKLEDIALELLDRYPSLSAYADDLRNLSLDMTLALNGGLERVALHLLKRVENQANTLNPQLLQRCQNMVLDYVIHQRFRMPQLLKYILERGACYEETRSFINGVDYSMYHAACSVGNWPHMMVVVQWEADMHGRDTFIAKI
ncbi:hypothetical protein F5Y09DRAFT_346217 [Xylaria sp. FL1042]|nr:hypothetical protein F5Y09DRAFT_346217 [Xylaria sp. FL1042]